MNQTFRDKPKSTTVVRSSSAPTAPMSHEVGGSQGDRSPDRTPDLNNVASSPGNVNERMC